MRSTAAMPDAALQLHFAACLRALGRAPVPQGASVRDRVRTMRELARYAWRGRFPRNPAPGTRHPIFRDHEGTPCAVGHLLLARGHAARVVEVATHRNTAYLHELAHEPWLAPTLLTLGLTVAEAARIQPSYPGYSVSPSEPDSLALAQYGLLDELFWTIRAIAIGASLVVALLWLLPFARGLSAHAGRLRGAAVVVAIGALLSIAVLVTRTWPACC